MTLVMAARGQGMPLGHADVFVAAAVRVLAVNASCVDEITTALRGPHICAEMVDHHFTDGRVAMAGPLVIDALKCGVDSVTLDQVDAPMLLSEMIYFSSNNNGLKVKIDVKNARVHIRRSHEIVSVKLTHGPLSIARHHWELWLDWAAKTYVPATSASRLGGAGAGLQDND